MTIALDTPRPLRADAVRNQRRVLEAADRLFATRGLDASLNDVAREAGVGVGTVYRKFADKNVLLDALFDVKVEQLVRLAEEAEREPDAAQGFQGFVLAVMEARATDPGLGAVVLRSRRGESFAAALGRQLDPKVGGLIARAQAAGALRDGFTPQDVCIIAVMVGTVADQTRGGDADLWRRYAQLLLDGTRPEASTRRLAPAALPPDDTADVVSGAH